MSLARFKKIFWHWRLRNEPLMTGFDAGAYRQLNVDVIEAGLDPWVHYLRFGRAERRDPNPEFSASGYVYVTPGAAHWPDPWHHYQAHGRAAGLQALPELAGSRTLRPEWPTLMLVGHQAGVQLYGAERSLIDLAEALQGFELNLVVVLPAAHNHDYVDKLRALSSVLAVVPYGWWREGRRSLEPCVAHFRDLLQRYSVDAVYANTSVLDEPMHAARLESVPVAVHVRELYASDPDLCRLLNTSPELMVARLTDLADVLVANSLYTAKSLALETAMLVPNCIAVEDFNGLSSPQERGEVFSVGLISSNIPKKGLNDFVRLASRCERQHPDWVFRLIGPENHYVKALKKDQRRGRVPRNLQFSGYAASAQAAIEQVDVLLNLSHVHESFGRTVLEAMAAERPVIVYDRGALPELVVAEETGFLAAVEDIEGVARALELLSDDPELRRRFGHRGRARARAHFSPKAQQEALWQVLDALGIMGAR